MRLDRDMRVEPRDRGRGTVDLGQAEIRCRMDDLPLQIGQRDHVIVDHAERADARRRQIHQHRRAEPARADDQHTRALERRLAGSADLAQHDVARITFQFVRGESRCTAVPIR